MTQVTTYVGIDAHKKDLFIAMLMGTKRKPVTWQLANEPRAVRRLVRKLEREAPGPVQVFYEAGPCGYALQRQMTTSRVHCEVVAPALLVEDRARKDVIRQAARQEVAEQLVGVLDALDAARPVAHEGLEHVRVLRALARKEEADLGGARGRCVLKLQVRLIEHGPRCCGAGDEPSELGAQVVRRGGDESCAHSARARRAAA